MFSEDQDIVDKLLADNEEFKLMYQRHQALNKKVDKAAIGEIPLSDDSVHELKKEKLLLKDRMAEIIKDYKQ